jgi:hypothetical protein
LGTHVEIVSKIIKRKRTYGEYKQEPCNKLTTSLETN